MQERCCSVPLPVRGFDKEGTRKKSKEQWNCVPAETATLSCGDSFNRACALEAELFDVHRSSVKKRNEKIRLAPHRVFLGGGHTSQKKQTVNV